MSLPLFQTKQNKKQTKIHNGFPPKLIIVLRLHDLDFLSDLISYHYLILPYSTYSDLSQMNQDLPLSLLPPNIIPSIFILLCFIMPSFLSRIILVFYLVTYFMSLPLYNESYTRVEALSHLSLNSA